jgi:hypothetical protein
VSESKYQVYAVYPSGKRYPVLRPHKDRYWASLHVRRCRETGDGTCTYQYGAVKP